MPSRPLAFLRLSEAVWLKRLRSPEARCAIRVGNVPGRLRNPPEWDTGRQVLQEHLVYFFAEGNGAAEIGGTSFSCGRGSGCWVTPGTRFRFSSKTSPLVWRFRFSVRAGGRMLAPRASHYHLTHGGAAAEAVNAILTELAHPAPWQGEALAAWLVTLSIAFFRAGGAAVAGHLTVGQQMAIARLLEDSAQGALTTRDLARASGLSPDYFTRVFRRTYGEAPRAWLVGQRLAHAIVLLQETPLRIGEIAERLGYENSHLFSRQFQARFGQSPRAWRQTGWK